MVTVTEYHHKHSKMPNLLSLLADKAGKGTFFFFGLSFEMLVFREVTCIV